MWGVNGRSEHGGVEYEDKNKFSLQLMSGFGSLPVWFSEGATSARAASLADSLRLASTKMATVVLVMVSPVAADKDSRNAPPCIGYLSREMTSSDLKLLVTLTLKIKLSVFVFVLVFIMASGPTTVLVWAGTPRASDRVSSTADLNVPLVTFSSESPAYVWKRNMYEKNNLG